MYTTEILSSSSDSRQNILSSKFVAFTACYSRRYRRTLIHHYILNNLIKLFLGNYNQIDFQIGQNTHVTGACATTLNNERYIFGGNGDGRYEDGGAGAHVERRLIKIEGCSLNRIGSIPFDLKMGTCRIFNFDGEEMVYVKCLSFIVVISSLISFIYFI